MARQQLGEGWPAYVYLSVPAASAVITAQRKRMGVPVADRGGFVGQQIEDASELACLAAWRMTQGIYRYDPALYTAMIDTPLTGDIPASILQRMPEWCVYVETPGMTVPSTQGELAAHGAWLWLDHDERGAHDSLHIGWDTDLQQLAVSVVPLVGSLSESIDRVLDNWAAARMDGATTDDPHPGLLEAYQRCVPPVLSLLLYLCSEAPDLTRRGKLDTPANPEPVRTRRHGWRLFAADGPREWDVGVRLGAVLRDAYQREQTGGDPSVPGHSVRPHVRRAHWHTFVSGATKRADGTPIPATDRRRELRWMPPIAVAVTDMDALPSIVRRVR